MTTSCQYAAFLEKIRENPADATAHLVFADWLEETGYFGDDDCHRRFAKELDECAVVLYQRDEEGGIIRLFFENGFQISYLLAQRLYGREGKETSEPHFYVERFGYEVLKGRSRV